jgi:hypothetical protein
MKGHNETNKQNKIRTQTRAAAKQNRTETKKILATDGNTILKWIPAYEIMEKRYDKVTRRYVLRHSNLQHILYVLSHRPLTTQAWLQNQILTREICGSGTGLPRSISAFPYQYHSTDAPYSFMNLLRTLYKHSN